MYIYVITWEHYLLIEMQFCRFSLTNCSTKVRFCKSLFINVTKNPRHPSFNVKIHRWLHEPSFQCQLVNRMTSHWGITLGDCVRKHKTEGKNQRKLVGLRPSITKFWLSMSSEPISYFSVGCKAGKFIPVFHTPSNSLIPFSFWCVWHVGRSRITEWQVVIWEYSVFCPSPRFSILLTTHHLDKWNNRMQRWCSQIVTLQG